MFVKALTKKSLVYLVAIAGVGSAAQAQTLHVLRPVNNAIVRETVPVRIAPGDLPSEGYVGITIDGQFKTARVLPANKRDAVYDWDTKAAYVTPDDLNAQKFVTDGTHTLTVKLYDNSGKSLGEQSVTLRVANKISVPSQGIRLAYHWRADQQQRYTRHTEAESVADGSTGINQTLQNSIIRFTRTVEDTTGGDYLIRDRILPGGVLINHGQPQYLDALYNIKSKYRTVDARGEILGSMAPLSVGDHFGFSIPVLSARRVSVGDTWQAPVEMSLEWASTKPITVTAESRLEGFEWQSGYPAAKIRESYSGPVTFVPASAAGMTAPAIIPGIPGAMAASSNGSITLPTVNYERIVYFAYNSGRLIRTETTVTLTVDNTQLANLGFAGVATGGAPAYGIPGRGPGQQDDNGPPNLGAGPPPGAYAPAGIINPFGAGPPPPGAGYPPPGTGYSGPGAGYSGPTSVQSTTTNLKVTDVTSQS